MRAGKRRVEASDGNVFLVKGMAKPIRLTNRNFRRIAACLKLPVDYLETLPATLACQLINHGLARRNREPS